MNAIILTQDSTPVIGWVAKILGVIMDAIFNVLDFIGIPNIGLAIILFTIVVNLLMLPLTMKQQKFSKLSAKMNPELQAIQAKYKNAKKDDQAAMMAQNQEVQAVYAKYGVSPSGSCLQLLIQMPILFALYRVIYAMPAYVGKLHDAFSVLAEKIISVDGANYLKTCETETISKTVMMYGNKMTDDNMVNGVIDVLNKLSTTDMAHIAEHYDLSGLTHNGELILSNASSTGLIDTYNNFLGLNVGNSPSHIVSSALETGAWLMIIGAIMIPLLSAVTQWINTKLMPQQEKSSGQENSMAQSMKTMNTIMPIMSAWFCYTLPCGMGIYWIAGSVVRSILQVVLNKHIDKMDFDAVIEKNSAKSAKKIEKMKKQQEMIDAYAKMNTKNIQGKASMSTGNDGKSSTSTSGKNTAKSTTKADTAANTSSKTGGTAKPGSMMEKANMVKQYNERNNNK